MKNFLFLLVAVTFVMAGCSKDPEPLTQTQVMTRLWKMQQYDIIIDDKVGATIYTRGGKSNTDDYSSFQFDFKSDGTFTQSDLDATGKTYQETGTWKLSNADKNLDLTFSDKTTLTFNVVSLTASELVVDQLTPVSSISAADLADLASYGLVPKTNLGTKLTFRP